LYIIHTEPNSSLTSNSINIVFVLKYNIESRCPLITFLCIYIFFSQVNFRWVLTLYRFIVHFNKSNLRQYYYQIDHVLILIQTYVFTELTNAIKAVLSFSGNKK